MRTTYILATALLVIGGVAEIRRRAKVSQTLRKRIVHREESLDEALEESFPASDPPSILPS